MEEVEDTTLMPTILRKESEDDKYGILDVKVKMKNGILIDFEMHILELPKLPPEQQNETDLMQWMRFLGGKNREDLKRMAEKNSNLREAYDELDGLSADERKRLKYEARQKAIRDKNILFKTGVERGRKDIILSMLKSGMTIEQIAEITKEPVENIKKYSK